MVPLLETSMMVMLRCMVTIKDKSVTNGLPKWKLARQVSLVEIEVHNHFRFPLFTFIRSSEHIQKFFSLVFFTFKMPQTQCCVPGCSTRGGHLIPKDLDI